MPAYLVFVYRKSSAGIEPLAGLCELPLSRAAALGDWCRYRNHTAESDPESLGAMTIVKSERNRRRKITKKVQTVPYPRRVT